MPVVTTRANAGASALGWGSLVAGEELGGMVLLTPSSVSKTGTSATVGTNGTVTFSACSVLSLNGVFSAKYRNYLISASYTSNQGNPLRARLRSSGTDDASANAYYRQELETSGTSFTGSSGTNSFWEVAFIEQGTYDTAFNMYLYCPFLADESIFRTVTQNNANFASIRDYSGIHDVSSSFDGITFICPGAMVLTGSISVYGLVGA